MDPGTFDLEKIQNLKMLGINRISLGVQSFDDEILKACGRVHRTVDTYNSLQYISQADVMNYNIDLISSLPYLTLPKWVDTLDEVLRTNCQHVSVYDLQIEENTAFGRWYSPGVFPIPSEDTAVLMYETAVTKLTSDNNFEHYEISNYAKLNKRSRHNQKYWQCKPTWGFGMSAASLSADGYRFSRPKQLVLYRDWINELMFKESSEGLEGISSKDMILQNVLTQQNQIDIFEAVMLSLRTKDGLNLREIGLSYGNSLVDTIWNALKLYIANGFVDVVQTEMMEIESIIGSNTKPDSVIGLRLTDPKGFLISNEIISSVFACLS